jgi:hypothetical protein
MADESDIQPEPEGTDLAALERMVSRAVFYLAIAVLVGTMFLTEHRRTPPAALLAIVGVFVLSKLAIFVVGLKRKWNQTPAVGMQVVAFATIGWIIHAGLTSSVPFVVVAALLLGAALYRRRVTKQDGE